MMKLYVYANLLQGVIGTSDYNLWSSKKSKETGLYKSSEVAFQLLDTLEIDLSSYKFDFVSGELQALELQLGDLHVKSESIKAQIQELKCLGHDSSEEEERMKDKVLGDENLFDQFDQDIPF